jgi:predicted Zn-dependent protease with MMP-like domain
MTRPPRRPPRPRRDRHGRGLRGRLVPAEVPLARTRGEQFDDLVLDAVEDLERRWERELAGVEFAVEDVPWVEHTDPDEVVLDSDVLDDGGVPLARLMPAHREDGREVPPRIIVYRRPLELRAGDRDDLAELVRDVVVDQVAVLLGRDPDEIDPTA